MENKEKIKVFEEELKDLSPEIKGLTEKALLKVNDKFFEKPASSTGKYHPVYSLGEGGLVRHTKAVVNFVQELTALKMFDFSKRDIDILTAAAILHDSCKSGINWEMPYTVHEHPILVKDLLSESELTSDEVNLWEEVTRTISSHMGQWNTSPRSSIVLPLPETKNQKLLHTADYLASRKQIDLSALFGIKNSNEDRKVVPPAATQKQKNLISFLTSKGSRLKIENMEKFQFLDVEALNVSQASVVIGELKSIVPDSFQVDGKPIEH